ncbi:MAG: class I SAM-dependent methyltransferase [Actinobacteria bacterium]|nr:class I SAM-dependent methyltransferase [Actinomycetota bacterium]NDD60793.1 class I SAM-dependent methyltransferase [Actinomycetota bacterium]
MPNQPRYLEVNFSESNKPTTEYPFRLARHLATRIPHSQGKLLDIGAGRGDMARGFQSLGFEVEIADINPESGEMSGTGFPFHAITPDGRLDAPSAQFDLVLFKSVIEHLRDPYPLLREIRRVLRPDGILICLTPDWKSNMDVFYDAVGHVQPYTTRSLRLTLEIAEFHVTSVEAFRQVPWTWTSLGRYFSIALSPAFRFIPRSVRRPGLRFLRERTLLAVAAI